MGWVIVGAFASVLIGVDVRKNPQSYRNVPLRFGDTCRSLWFWPGNLVAAHASTYKPKHRKKDLAVPDYMRSWRLR
jgi:hypothetical protein